MQSKKKWFVVFILLAALAGAAFYFLYFIRTPAYALNEARVALQQHDSAKNFHDMLMFPLLWTTLSRTSSRQKAKINNDNVFLQPFSHSAFCIC